MSRICFKESSWTYTGIPYLPETHRVMNSGNYQRAKTRSLEA
jgi:hypothetical protein